MFLSNLEIASLVKGTDLDYGYGIISIFFLFSDDEESLYSTGLKLHNDIDLIDYNMELKKGG